MMEQAHTSERHHHIVRITGRDDIVVAHGASGLRYKAYAALSRSFNIIAKRGKMRRWQAKHP